MDSLNATTIAYATITQMQENSTIDWIMSKMDQFPIKISFFFACAMVIGSVVPYVPQYFTIKQTQNTEGFSLYVCLTLLVANILRIMFWFGKHFETALLIQSVVMILAMFILLELCVRVRNSNLIIQHRKRYFAGDSGGLTASAAKCPTDVANEERKPSKCLQRSTSLDGPKKAKSNSIIPNSFTTVTILAVKDLTNETNQSKSNDSNDVDTKGHCDVSRETSGVETLFSSHKSPKNSTDAGSQPTRSASCSLSSISSLHQTPSVDRKSSKKTKHSLRSESIDSVHSETNKSTSANCVQSIPKRTDNNVEKDDNVSSQENTIPQNEITNDPTKITEAKQASQEAENPKDELKNCKDIKNGDVPPCITGNASGGVDVAAVVLDHQVVSMADTAQNVDSIKDLFEHRRFIDFEFRYFWEWTDFMSYLECMGVFAFFAGLFIFFFIDVPWIVESYGLIALITESLLASPQFYRNFKTKSTEGMSRIMVLTWLIGDLYKTIYFIVREAPFQFLICGCTQITFDILIFFQVVFYKKATYRKLSKSRTFKHLESRARKRFKANIRAKKMINLLSTISPTSSHCPTLTIALADHSHTVKVTESGYGTVISSVLAPNEQQHANSPEPNKTENHVRFALNEQSSDLSDNSPTTGSRKVAQLNSDGCYINNGLVDGSDDSYTAVVQEYRAADYDDDDEGEDIEELINTSSLERKLSEH